MCNACSLSMGCLSEILNAMLGITKQGNVPKLKNKIKGWKGNLLVCENVYKESDKGKNFIQSLYKMIDCIENFREYKKINTWEEKRDLKECIDDLSEIAKNIEGPLQKVIEDVTKQMDYCKIKTLYGIETKSFLKKDASQEFGTKRPAEQNIDSSNIPEQNKNFKVRNWIRNHPVKAIAEISVGVIGTVIGTVIAEIILKKYFS